MSETERPLIFGEVLFDVFADGSDVLGGAPFNVAWHLQGLGLAPLVISRVGDDERGRRVVEAMRGHGLDTGGVQRAEGEPTGVVTVTIGDAGPRFAIPARQAFDFIDADAARLAVREIAPRVVYHGSLAARHEVSRAALDAVLDATRGVPRFIDLNLRAPWWTRETVDALAHRATHIKLNDDELAQLWPTFAALTEETSLAEHANTVRRALEAEMLVITRAERGALICTERGTESARPPRLRDVVDTVGAGDAFSAVVIAGMLHDWPVAATLRRALAFAGEICMIRGALPPERDIYERTLRAWQQEADG